MATSKTLCACANGSYAGWYAGNLISKYPPLQDTLALGRFVRLVRSFERVVDITPHSRPQEEYLLLCLTDIGTPQVLAPTNFPAAIKIGSRIASGHFVLL